MIVARKTRGRCPHRYGGEKTDLQSPEGVVSAFVQAVQPMHLANKTPSWEAGQMLPATQAQTVPPPANNYSDASYTPPEVCCTWPTIA
jgi:hypothetical protein